jgi:hypothetical protein
MATGSSYEVPTALAEVAVTNYFISKMDIKSGYGGPATLSPFGHD